VQAIFLKAKICKKPAIIGSQVSLGKALMTFEEDVKYYQTIQKTLAKEHSSKFVLIKDKANRGIFSSFEDAHKEALRRFGNADVLIIQVGVDPPLNYLAPVA
jgi:hypothetical protein